MSKSKNIEYRRKERLVLILALIIEVERISHFADTDVFEDIINVLHSDEMVNAISKIQKKYRLTNIENMIQDVFSDISILIENTDLGKYIWELESD